jgi:hypothetical protein
MPSRSPDIEIALIAALRARGDLYRDAHASLAALQRRLQAGETMHRIGPELQRVLTRVRTADEELAPLMDAWRKLSVSPGAELSMQISRHQAELERTLGLVDQLAAAAAADRSSMAPRLDEAARGRRMQAAYAATIVGGG